MARRRETLLAGWLADRAAREPLRMFDGVPDGVLLLDSKQQIVDLNPAAERILGSASAVARGARVADIFPEYEHPEPEIVLGTGGGARHYALYQLSLESRHGLPLGFLVLLRDITMQERDHDRIVAEQTALATVRERDRIARELHDSLGQVLGYVKMQVRAAREMLAQGKISETEACLERLGAVAQDAHADVHEYILGTAGLSGAGLTSKLETYLQRFSGYYGITAKLNVSPAWVDRVLNPAVETQLLCIVQEALSNVRKHARAQAVRVCLDVAGDRAEAVVRDDGAGFDPRLLDSKGQKFGLGFMRERAREVGGSVEIQSEKGEGTRVVVSVPLKGDRP